jgi:hypothetical protein
MRRIDPARQAAIIRTVQRTRYMLKLCTANLLTKAVELISATLAAYSISLRRHVYTRAAAAHGSSSMKM